MENSALVNKMSCYKPLRNNGKINLDSLIKINEKTVKQILIVLPVTILLIVGLLFVTNTFERLVNLKTNVIQL